jgi:hypothetical protein
VLHSAAATRNESISDIIERLNAEHRSHYPVIGRSALYSGPGHFDDLDLFAAVGKPRAATGGMGAPEQEYPPAPGPAAILAIFGRMLQRARWALYRNRGRAASSWSAGERLSVALVLGDQEALAELGYTPDEAADAVSAVLALPPNEIDGWIGELRAIL